MHPSSTYISLLTSLRGAFLLLISLLLNMPAVQAQSDSIEWKAHIVVEQKWRGLSDTIAIGCSYQGGKGYQDSLDIIDTDFTAPLSIRGSDLQIANDSGTCPPNMRQDIRVFDTTVVFRFYVKSDTFPGYWWEEMPRDSINLLKWDTSELIYEDKRYRLDYITIYSYGGYMDVMDGNSTWIKSEKYWNGGGEVRLILERPGVWFTDSACDDPNYVMAFDLECQFTDLTDTVHVPEPGDKAPEVEIKQAIKAHYLQFEFASPFSGEIQVYNLWGQLEKTISLQDVSSAQLEYTGYPKGVYILRLQEKTTQRVMTRKFTVF